jgi:hypothetical protein
MWEYKIVEASIADKWSAKKQAAELVNLQTRLNEQGSEGWELISYESVPIYGSFSSSLKGYAYLLFFKRKAA